MVSKQMGIEPDPRSQAIFTPRNYQVPVENANTILRHAVSAPLASQFTAGLRRHHVRSCCLARGRHEACQWPGTASLIRRRNDAILGPLRRPLISTSCGDNKITCSACRYVCYHCSIMLAASPADSELRWRTTLCGAAPPGPGRNYGDESFLHS